LRPPAVFELLGRAREAHAFEHQAALLETVEGIRQLLLAAASIDGLWRLAAII